MGDTDNGMERGTPRRDDEPGLDRSIQDHIGRQLKTMYDTLSDQPLPDRFRGLLDQLEGKDIRSA